MLGGMARELDSEGLRRLQQAYGEMSDKELLALAASPDELTDMAQEVLRAEMTRRALKPEAPEEPAPVRRWASDALPQDRWPEPAVSSSILGAGASLDSAPPESSGIAPDESLLGTYYDAIEVGRACSFLEEAEVPFRVEDVAKPRSGASIYDSPPVALNLIVSKQDRERAMAVLRKTMGLFPLQEVEEPDAEIDDGTVSILGNFAGREDAEAVAKTLEDARIWHRVVANPEGSVASEDAWTLEVREIDLVKAGDVVERAMSEG